MMINFRKLGDTAYYYLQSVTNTQYWSLLLYGVALLLALAASATTKYNFWEALLHTLVFFSVGLQGLWTAIRHLKDHKQTIMATGKQSSHHDIEIGVAHLALAVAALLTLLKPLWAAPVALVSILFFAGSLYAYYKGYITINWGSHSKQGKENAIMVYTSIATTISLFLALLLG